MQQQTGKDGQPHVIIHRSDAMRDHRQQLPIVAEVYNFFF